MSKIVAGDLTTIVVLSGSFLRPVGGWLGDRFGGFRLLIGLFGFMSICLMIVSTLPAITIVVPFLFVVMGMLGMGNGAVFQIAPQRFPHDIELITGIVGAAGGLGGFFLPSVLGLLKDVSGSYATGLFSFSLLIIASTFLLLEFGVRWSYSWRPSAIIRTQVFAYRAGSGSISSGRSEVAQLESVHD